MILSSRAYELVKWFVTIVMPAFSAAYYAIGAIWGLPNTEAVVGTMAIITTFLGTVLGVSTLTYNASDAKYDGEIHVVQDPGGMKTIALQVPGDPETAVMENDQLLFKINKTGSPE